MALKWKHVWKWDLSRNEQVLWIADGRDVQYKIARTGTADKPRWWLYTREPDGMESCCHVSKRLREVKSHALSLEQAATADR